MANQFNPTRKIKWCIDGNGGFTKDWNHLCCILVRPYMCQHNSFLDISSQELDWACVCVGVRNGVAEGRTGVICCNWGLGAAAQVCLPFLSSLPPSSSRPATGNSDQHWATWYQRPELKKVGFHAAMGSKSERITWDVKYREYNQ